MDGETTLESIQAGVHDVGENRAERVREPDREGIPVAALEDTLPQEHFLLGRVACREVELVADPRVVAIEVQRQASEQTKVMDMPPLLRRSQPRQRLPSDGGPQNEPVF